MNIKELLQSAHSKNITTSIVNEIISGNTDIKELMLCFFSKDQRLCQRAAWPVGIIGEKKSELLTPYIREMIKAASNPLHNAITRNVVRAFQYMSISEKHEGEVYDFCFRNVTDLSQPIAVRCFSFRTCLKIAKKHPELVNEVVELITLLEPDESPAVQSVIKKARRELKV